MKRFLPWLIIIMLSGCAGMPNPLGSGGLAGASSISLTCPDGKSTVTYNSGGLLPQTNPVTATCTSGGQTSIASVTGIDINAITTAIVPLLMQKGVVAAPTSTPVH